MCDYLMKKATETSPEPNLSFLAPTLPLMSPDYSLVPIQDLGLEDRGCWKAKATIFTCVRRRLAGEEGGL